MHGVKGSVVTPCVVSQVVSLHGYGGCRVTAMFVAWPQWVSSHYVVSQRVSSCRGRDGCVTPCGAAVAVVALHGGVVVMVITLCVVSRSRSSHHVVVWSCRMASSSLSSPSSHCHCGWWLGHGRPWRERTAVHLLAKMKLAGKRKKESCTSRVSQHEECGNVAHAATRVQRPGKVSRAVGKECSVMVCNCEAQGNVGAC